MIEKLSQKDRRTLKIGAVCLIAIVAFVFARRWFNHWAQVRNSLAAAEAKLELIDVGEAKRAGLMSMVPVFEMPEKEETQKFLFRDKFNEQLKKAGMKSEALQFLPIGKSRQAGYKLLRLQCRRGKCKFGQVLDLLARLNENPYLVGIEELKIECDPKKRHEVNVDLVMSTFVK